MTKHRQEKIGIAAKVSHPEAVELVRELVEYSRKRKLDYRLDRETASVLRESSGSSTIPPLDQVVDRSALTTACGVIVVLGGDGTLISVSRHPSPESAKIIGVNLGTLGFLTEITVDELFPTLEKTLAGEATTQVHRLLAARVQGRTGAASEHYAVNDVVLSKEALARIFAINFSMNGAPAATIRGDGVIISTPGGSTAYSLAAGGSIVHPAVDALLVTPICPHSLTCRPLVLPSDSIVRLEIGAESKLRDGEVYLTVDGQEGYALSGGAIIEVTTSTFQVEMVKSPSRTYFELLGTKLKWANS